MTHERLPGTPLTRLVQSCNSTPAAAKLWADPLFTSPRARIGAVMAGYRVAPLKAAQRQQQQLMRLVTDDSERACFS